VLFRSVFEIAVIFEPDLGLACSNRALNENAGTNFRLFGVDAEMVGIKMPRPEMS
jgi:hypothetical protein